MQEKSTSREALNAPRANSRPGSRVNKMLGSNAQVDTDRHMERLHTTGTPKKHATAVAKQPENRSHGTVRGDTRKC